MKTKFFILASIVGAGAVPQSSTADILPNAPSKMSGGGQICIYNMYEQARNGQNDIFCSKDRSPACVCKAESVRFWYGLRDCSLSYGQAVYTEIANWKDNVLCRNGGAAIQPATTVRPSPTQAAKPTAVPTAAPAAAPQITVIPFVEDGVTSFMTRTLKPTPTAKA